MNIYADNITTPPNQYNYHNMSPKVNAAYATATQTQPTIKLSITSARKQQQKLHNKQLQKQAQHKGHEDWMGIKKSRSKEDKNKNKRLGVSFWDDSDHHAANDNDNDSAVDSSINSLPYGLLSMSRSVAASDDNNKRNNKNKSKTKVEPDSTLHWKGYDNVTGSTDIEFLPTDMPTLSTLSNDKTEDSSMVMSIFSSSGLSHKSSKTEDVAGNLNVSNEVLATTLNIQQEHSHDSEKRKKKLAAEKQRKSDKAKADASEAKRRQDQIQEGKFKF